MTYIWYYSATTALFLSVVTFFYLREPRIPNLADRLYSVMLVGGLAAALFDALSGGLEPIAAGWPQWPLYLFNSLMILGQHICLPAFLFYALTLSGNYARLNRRARRLLLTPFVTVVALVLLSYFTPYGIFYIDENNFYQYGALHSVLYVVSALYLLSGSLVTIIWRRQFSPVSFYSILVFCGVIFVSIGLQLLLPGYLLTTTATGVSLVMMYCLMQSPRDHIDPVTDLLDRSALPALLQNRYSRGDEFTVLLFVLKEHGLVTRTLGTRAGEQLLAEFASVLKAAYPRRQLLRMRRSAFLVLELDTQSEQEALERVRAVGCTDELYVASLCSASFENRQALTEAIGVLLQTPPPSGDILAVDCAFIERIRSESRRQDAFQRALKEKKLRLERSPLTAGGEFYAAALYPAMDDPALSGLRLSGLLRLAQQTNNVPRFSDLFFTLVFEHISASQKDGTRFIVPLAPALLMLRDSGERIRALSQSCGAQPSRVCLAVTEYMLTGSVPAVKDNIKALAEQGFTFCLYRFGAGYANFAAISGLPFTCVWFSTSHSEETTNSEARRQLLSGVTDMLHALSLITITDCPESAEERAMLQSCGLDVFAGR